MNSNKNINKEQRIVNGGYVANQVFNQMSLDTQTIYMPSGNINVKVCPWHNDQRVTVKGGTIRYRTRTEVQEDGTTYVRPVREGLYGPVYKTVFETAHGVVKYNDGKTHPERAHLKVEFRFPARYGTALIRSLLAEEQEQVKAFLLTRKEETVW